MHRRIIIIIIIIITIIINSIGLLLLVRSAEVEIFAYQSAFLCLSVLEYKLDKLAIMIKSATDDLYVFRFEGTLTCCFWYTCRHSDLFMRVFVSINR